MCVWVCVCFLVKTLMGTTTMTAARSCACGCGPAPLFVHFMLLPAFYWLRWWQRWLPLCPKLKQSTVRSVLYYIHKYIYILYIRVRVCVLVMARYVRACYCAKMAHKFRAFSPSIFPPFFLTIFFFASILDTLLSELCTVYWLWELFRAILKWKI